MGAPGRPPKPLCSERPGEAAALLELRAEIGLPDLAVVA